MVDYPGAKDFIITDPAWVFTDALLAVPNTELTVVDHKTACGGFCTATDVANSFRNDTVNHKSVHFIVGKDGSVLQVVLLKDGAGGNCCLEAGHNSYWDPLTAKYGNLNRCTISIEHEDWTPDNSDPMPPAQVDASHKLNAWLQKRYSLTQNQFHSHESLDPISRARCPGPTFDWQGLFNYMFPPSAPVLSGEALQAATILWNSTNLKAPFDSGIAKSWKEAFATSAFMYGPPVALEEDYTLNRRCQVFSNAICIWDGQPQWIVYK